MKSVREYLEEKIQYCKENDIFIAQIRLKKYLDKTLEEIQDVLLACKETDRYTKYFLRDALIDLEYDFSEHRCKLYY